MDGEQNSTLSKSGWLKTNRRGTEILIMTKYLMRMVLSAEFVQQILVLICVYGHLAQSGECCKKPLTKPRRRAAQ